MARVAARGGTSVAIHSGHSTPTRSSSRALLSPLGSGSNHTDATSAGGYSNNSNNNDNIGWESPQVPGSPLPGVDTGLRQRGLSSSNAAASGLTITTSAGPSPSLHIRTLSSPGNISSLAHSGVATTTGAIMIRSSDGGAMPISNSTLSSFDVRRLPSHAPVDSEGNIINVNELHTDNFNFNALKEAIDVSNMPILERTHLFLHGYLGRWSIICMHTILVIILVCTYRLRFD
jgi:hypothetical protein